MTFVNRLVLVAGFFLLIPVGFFVLLLMPGNFAAALIVPWAVSAAVIYPIAWLFAGR